MRIERALLCVLGICAAAPGCGAKVTVDLGSQGAGGTGGTTTTGPVTGTTGTGTSCSPESCTSSNEGSCDCMGTCNLQKFEVQCSPVTGGGDCTCIENGIKIATCQQPGTATCNLTTECCAAQFFSGATTGGG